MTSNPAPPPASTTDLGIRLLVQRFALFAVLISLVTLLSYGSVEYLLREEYIHSEQLNRAGRQRMLSQRIALYAGHLVAQPNNDTARRELRKAIATMDAGHQFLKRSLGGHNPLFLDLFEQAPVNLDLRIAKYLAQAQIVLSNPNDAAITLAWIRQQAESPLILSLETLVQKLEEHVERSGRNTLLLHRVLTLIILGSLGFGSWYIIRPAIRRIAEEQQQLQASEARFRTMSDSLPVLVSQVDSNLHYQFVNLAYSEAFQQPRDAITGRALWELLGNEFIQANMPNFQMALIGQIVHQDLTLDLPGGQRVFQATYLPQYDEHQAISGFLAVEIDITERQEREQTLEEARNTAEQARRQMQSFVANISHEIRTPLNAVLGFAELLGREDLPDAAQWQVDSIQNGARSLLQLINDLLDLSKLEAGQMPVKRQPVNLQQLLNETRRLFISQAEAQGLYLRVEVDDGDQLPLLDESLMRQILLNLVGNAIKFTEVGGVSVRASLSPGADNHRYTLTVLVTDSGPGIEAAFQEVIFLPFRQRDGSDTRRHGGTGLGLSISRHLAELLGGNLTVSSELGVGATFTLTLPDLALAVRAEPVATPSTPSSSPRFAPSKVLVVDDDPLGQEFLAILLRKAGLVVETANDGQEGLDCIKTLHPALVLLDMQMPVMDGYTLLNIVKGLPELARIPILACTASSIHEQSEELRQLCEGVIPKPVNAKALMQTLEKFLPLEHPSDTISPALAVDLPPEVREALRCQVAIARQRRTQSLLRELAQALCQIGHQHSSADLSDIGEALEQALAKNQISQINRLLKRLDAGLAQ